MRILTLASSSSGNCTIVSYGNTHVLIDAGISLRRIRDGLRRMDLTPGDLTCVFVTHEHIDHIKGINILVKYHKTPIFTSPGTGLGISNVIPESEPYMNCFSPGGWLEIGDIAVRSFATPHDSFESVGYELRAGGKTLVYATDLGRLTEEVVIAACETDVAIIEANHDTDMLKRGPYPESLKRRILSDHGHLSNSDSARFAVQLADFGARYMQLAHLSRENNTPALARDTVEFALYDFGAMVGKDVELDVAPPDTPGRLYDI